VDVSKESRKFEKKRFPVTPGVDRSIAVIRSSSVRAYVCREPVDNLKRELFQLDPFLRSEVG
jgi:hypothetical protein